ncbi:hypothetical protein E2C01_010529 [Portunus trituberculatus]|uniref:Uncharacterized protein n=1 Tax=Portunus trituberculatus TaxID=210409 RepID=A0A5B7D912_PORTR|nr:hypothetical protein [Portunus trituberculatus]
MSGISSQLVNNLVYNYLIIHYQVNADATLTTFLTVVIISLLGWNDVARKCMGTVCGFTMQSPEYSDHWSFTRVALIGLRNWSDQQLLVVDQLDQQPPDSLGCLCPPYSLLRRMKLAHIPNMSFYSIHLYNVIQHCTEHNGSNTSHL